MSESNTETTKKKNGKQGGKRTRRSKQEKQQIYAHYQQYGVPKTVKDFGISKAGVYKIASDAKSGKLKLPRKPKANGASNGAPTVATVAVGDEGNYRQRRVDLAPSSALVPLEYHQKLIEENKALRVALRMAIKGEL